MGLKIQPISGSEPLVKPDPGPTKTPGFGSATLVLAHQRDINTFITRGSLLYKVSKLLNIGMVLIRYGSSEYGRNA